MQKGRYLIWTYFTSAGFFILGCGAAYLMVYNFSARAERSVGANSIKKDSTAKVVEAKTYYPDTDTATDLFETRNNRIELKLSPQKGRQLPRNIPPPIQPTQAATAAAHLSYEYSLNKINAGWVWMGGFLALAIMIIAFFAKKDSVLNATEIDSDPPDLEILIETFRKRIELFRNPRKVLRFLNLVKYHYYFLVKNGIEDMASLKKMMYILLEIQDDPELVSIKGIKREELSMPAWFYKRIVTKSWHAESGITASDDQLLMILLKLNIDMGA